MEKPKNAAKKRYPKKIWIEKEDFEMLNTILDETYEPGTTRWFNLKLLYHILYWSGLRISEALNLSRKQIIDYLNGQSIQVVIAKTYSTRSLLNTKNIYDKLSYFRENESLIGPNGFENSFGRALSFRTCNKWSYPIMYKLQLHKFGKVDDPSKLLITLHSFRCSFINRLIRSGVPLPDVSQIVHHKNISTTMGYLRAYPNIDPYNKMLNDKEF